MLPFATDATDATTYAPQNQPAPGPDLRRVFLYSVDGSRLVYGDPMVINRKFRRAVKELTGGTVEDLWNAAYPTRETPEGTLETPPLSPEQIEAAIDAETVLAEATVRAFGLTALDPATGLGLTEDEILAQFHAFNLWMNEVKKNTGISPSSADATAVGPATSESSPAATSSSVSG